MSNSSAGLGFHSGQEVNIPPNLNSTLFHVYTDLQQILEALNQENPYLISTRTPPRCPRADVPHAWPRRERDALTISYIRIPFHGLDMALLVRLYFLSQ